MSSNELMGWRVSLQLIHCGLNAIFCIIRGFTLRFGNTLFSRGWLRNTTHGRTGAAGAILMEHARSAHTEANQHDSYGMMPGLARDRRLP